MDHVKAVFNWFSKSPARKAKLKRLHKDMQLLRDTVTWKMMFPKYYCPTRWLGIHRAVLSIISAGDLLEEYTDRLLQGGMLPQRGVVADNLPAVAAHARLEEDSDSDEGSPELVHDDSDDSSSEDDDSDKSDEGPPELVHDADFYEWGTDAWDLHFTTPAHLDIADEETRLSMDIGRATTWKVMPTRKTKTSWLLSERVGLTAEMLGVDCIMADALLPYKLLVERLQVRTVPIGHNVRRWCCQMFKQLRRMFLNPRPFYGAHYKQWTVRADVADDLSEQVFFMGQQFVVHFLGQVRHRLRPY